MNDLCSLDGIGPEIEQLFWDAEIDFDFYTELGIGAEIVKKKQYIPFLVAGPALLVMGIITSAKAGKN